MILSSLSYIFKSNGPKYEGGIYYIAFVIIYAFILYLLKKKISIHPISLSKRIFFLGVIPFLFVTPLFENDHYRYIWEGKVILSGENPYIYSPNHPQLNKVDFSVKKNIGFPELTTVYPPLGLLFFTLGSFFKFELALRILILLNGLLVFYWFRLLSLYKIKTEYLLLCIPYMQKEFIGSIHIDLFASIFLLIPLTALYNKTSISYKKSLIYSCLSYWSKILGIISLPFFYLFHNEKSFYRKNCFFSVLAILSLPLFFLFTLRENYSLIGVSSFSKNWIWNPGLYALLELITDMSQQTRRHICLLIYTLIYLFTFIRFYKYRKARPKYYLLIESFLLIYSALMFTTPVFNGWYAIWFLPFALILNNRTGVYYAIFTCFSYLPYGHLPYRYYGHFLNHILFVIMIYQFFLIRNTNTNSN